MKVFIDTSFISDLTSRPSSNERNAQKQKEARECWEKLKGVEGAEIYVSQTAYDEMASGDGEAKERRLEILKDVKTVPDANAQIQTLANRLVEETIVPSKERNDALIIAAASYYRADILISSNMKHIANDKNYDKLGRLLRQDGGKETAIKSPQGFIDFLLQLNFFDI